jgi:transmembrane 9 superfamily protein 2/4
VLLILGKISNAFSLPGILPKNYQKGEGMEIYAGPLTSKHGSLNKAFYSLPWCDINKGLAGAFEGTPFDYNLGKNKAVETCKKVWTKEDVDRFIFFAQKDYEYKLYLDDLPSATITRDRMDEQLFNYFDGVPLGKYDERSKKWFIFNHLDITVETHLTIEGMERIVGFDIEPMSLKDDSKRMEFRDAWRQPPKILEPDTEITFSYSVHNKVNKQLTWATRMDHYVKFENKEIHYLQLIFSFSIVTVLGLVIAYILKNKLNMDYASIAAE